jgi:hypothetical protein
MGLFLVTNVPLYLQSDNKDEFLLSAEQQRKLVQRLSMKRRGYRMEMTDERRQRLKKTWATLVKKSENAGYLTANEIEY